jgi:hypothetical protein
MMSPEPLEPLLADPCGRPSAVLSSLADPYLEAREQVQESLRILRAMHLEWKDLLFSANTAKSERFKHLHSEIAGELEGIREDLDGISLAMKVVESDRARYPVDDAEVAARHEFLRTSREAAEAVRKDVKSSHTTQKLESDRRDFLLHTTKSASEVDLEEGKASALARAAAANDAFLGLQRREQEQIYAQQDDYLVDIGRSAERLKMAAHEMGTEIKYHNELLEDLDRDIDKETENLNRVMKHVGRLLKTSDQSHICVILGLMALLVVLLFLIIS